MKRECYGVNLGCFRSPDTSEIYRQNKAKTAGKRNAARGNRKNTSKRRPPRPWGPLRSGRGSHHGPWWPLWWFPDCFPPCAAFSSFGVSPWSAGFAFSWVFWASLQASFDPHGPHLISLDSSQTFLPKSWLES